MKNKKIIMNILVLSILLLFTAKTVMAGVTYPIPSQIQLMPGEQDRFRFTVTSTSDSDQQCTINPDKLVPLAITFDELEFTITSEEKIKLVMGTVSASSDALNGDYKETFSVTCRPITEGEGSTVSTTINKIPINIQVVSERTKENIDFREPRQVPTYFYYVLVILIILIIAYIIFRKRNK